MRYIDADLGRNPRFEWQHVNGRLLEEVTQAELTDISLLESKHQASWLYRALGVSLFLHAFLLSLPPLDAARLQLATSKQASPLLTRLRPLPAAEPTEQTQRQQVQQATPAKLPVTLDATGSIRAPRRPQPTEPAAEAPAGAQSSPPVTSSPFVSERSPDATVRQLRVTELFPAAINVPLDLGDGSIDWHDATRMRKLPLAIDTPELILPGLNDFPLNLPPVQLCLRIQVDGVVEGIQLLTPPNPLDEVLVETLSKIRFIPGKDRFDTPVPSLMILEFEIETAN